MIHRLNSCVLIPAYNEERRLFGVIEKVRELGFEVLIVDDGSTDKTASVVKSFSEHVHLLSLPNNQGKGAAIRKGFTWTMENGFEAVVVMDADGQHRADELEDFLTELAPAEADIVVGNRMNAPAGMPLLRRLTNQVMSGIVSAVAGQKIPDSQCGFRALTREAVQRLNLDTDRFEIESEMLMQAGRIGLKIKSIPISSLYQDEVSHIRPLQDTLRFFAFLIRFIFAPY